MSTLAARSLREIYRRELLPSRVRWWLAAQGMQDWFRTLASGLTPHFADDRKKTRALLSQLAVRMFERRHEALQKNGVLALSSEKNHSQIALLHSALYRLRASDRSAWIFDALGGIPSDPLSLARQQSLLLPFRPEERWKEVTTHLGELLIVLTEDLPPHLAHSRKILGDICFSMGARFGEQSREYFGIEKEPADPAAAALEILRMSEYLFRVNPEHWGNTNQEKHTGWLEGTACPWYDRPGWNGAHCGIFGQFQSGVCSVFGLRYRLSQTIPKHGGHTCRIDVEPVPASALVRSKR